MYLLNKRRMIITMYSYKQFCKGRVRHLAIQHAVEALTVKRTLSSFVGRWYVRKVYDYYTGPEDNSSNKKETNKIDVSYITNWENYTIYLLG